VSVAKAAFHGYVAACRDDVVAFLQANSK